MKRLLLLLLSITFILFNSPKDSKALQYASTTWNDFKAKSDLIVKVRVIKAEMTSGGYSYTCEVLETFKGQKLKRVIFTGNRMHFYSLRIYETGILALRKDNSKWKLAVAGRSYWPIKYEMKPDLHTIVRVAVDDFLINDFPKRLKKTFTLKTLLVNGKYRKYSAKVYLLSDIEKFLRSHFK